MGIGMMEGVVWCIAVDQFLSEDESMGQCE